MAEAIHGGRLWAEARALGLEPASMLDFSANLNPAGPPTSVMRAIREALPQALFAYPDSDSPQLRDLLCQRHGTAPEHLVLGAGGAALLLLALRALAPRRILIPTPCFSEQPRAAKAAGAEMVARPMPDLCLDLEALDPRGCDAVLLTNPHNPTGQLLSRETLAAWIRAHPELAVIVDEAFMDYAPGESLLPELLSRPRTVILRSLTKFYAMPGLRVGYAFADAVTAGSMSALQEGWPVGQLELLSAQAALEDEAYAAATLAAFRAHQPAWGARLRTLPGVEVMASAAPFFLLKLSRPHGTRIAQALRREGILVRTCEAWPGLDDRYLRVAVKDPADHDRLFARLSILV